EGHLPRGAGDATGAWAAGGRSGDAGPPTQGDLERVSTGPDLRASPGGVHGGGEWRRPPRKRGFRRSLARRCTLSLPRGGKAERRSGGFALASSKASQR
ncbi:unnamed protein product, partial [Symbiodinium necroappetens]